MGDDTLGMDADNPDELAADLALAAKDDYEEAQAEQEEFLNTVAEEEGEAPIETECNIIGEYTVPVRAKMNGELIDRMSAVQAQGKRIERDPEAEGHKMSEVADEMCQVLADVINDPEWTKRKFYQAYRAEGPEPILTMLDRVFDSLKKEKERMEGRADGFRTDAGGA